MNIQSWKSEIDGPLTETALVDKLSDLGYVCTRYIYPPGTCFPLHSHELDKIDAVLRGSFRITTADSSLILNAGDYVHVPAYLMHSAEVIGNDPVVSIDAIRISNALAS